MSFMFKFSNIPCFYFFYFHLSLFPSFPFSDMLCDPTDLIWKYGTPLEAMTGCTAFINGLLPEVTEREDISLLINLMNVQWLCLFASRLVMNLF